MDDQSVRRQLIEVLNQQRTATPIATPSATPAVEVESDAHIELKREFAKITAETAERDEALLQARMARNALQGTVASLTLKFQLMSERLKLTQSQYELQARALAGSETQANKASKLHLKEALKINTYEEQMKTIANVAKRVYPKKRRFKIKTVTATIA
eukprot:1462334-Prymnesium_polylepis.1